MEYRTNTGLTETIEVQDETTHWQGFMSIVIRSIHDKHQFRVTIDRTHIESAYKRLFKALSPFIQSDQELNGGKVNEWIEKMAQESAESGQVRFPPSKAGGKKTKTLSKAMSTIGVPEGDVKEWIAYACVELALLNTEEGTKEGIVDKEACKRALHLSFMVLHGQVRSFAEFSLALKRASLKAGSFQSMFIANEGRMHEYFYKWVDKACERMV